MRCAQVRRPAPGYAWLAVGCRSPAASQPSAHMPHCSTSGPDSQAGRYRDKLVKRFHLSDFLLATVQIPEVRGAFHHLFPIELEQQPQYPMRAGMLGPHVNYHAAQTACHRLHCRCVVNLGHQRTWEGIWGGLFTAGDLLLYLYNAIDQRFWTRRTSSHVNIHRQNLVDPLQHAIGTIHPSRRGTDPMAITHFGSGI